jgi:hypothetical protein
MINDDILLPCPFCGGGMEVTEHRSLGTLRWSVGHKDKSCKVNLYTEPTVTAQEAIEIWNKRILKKSARKEALEKLAEELLKWEEAYPVDIFTEPTPQQVDVVCRQLGFNIDRISAMILRSFAKQWGDKAREALKK